VRVSSPTLPFLRVIASFLVLPAQEWQAKLLFGFISSAFSNHLLLPQEHSQKYSKAFLEFLLMSRTVHSLNLSPISTDTLLLSCALQLLQPVDLPLVKSLKHFSSSFPHLHLTLI